MKFDKVAEVTLVLEGRKYFRDNSPHCWTLDSEDYRDFCEGDVLVIINDTDRDSFGLACEKHSKGIPNTHWKVYEY